MADQKIVYRFDNNIFTSTDIVSEDYQLKDNETFDPVPQGAREPVHRIGGQSGSWQQATEEENAEYLKEMQSKYPQMGGQPAGPSEQEKFNATATVQLANLMQANQDQKKINANLTLQIAQLLKADQTTDTKTTDTTAQANA